ncbi:MAG: helix-turn-helix domain-containing protein [Christensenellales bacterium]|jgi:AraC-like DNA-binding protein
MEVGYTYADSISGEESLCLYHGGWERCRGGHVYGPAVRDHYLIHFVFSGQGVFTMDGMRHPLRAGQCFLIEPGVVTVYRADQDDPWYYGWIGVQGRDCPRILEQCSLTREHPVTAYSDPVRMEQCIRALSDPYSAHNPFAVLSRLYEIFSLMHTPARHRSGSDRVEQASEYILRHFSYPTLSVADVAHYVGVDRSQLFRLFKHGTGLSPQEFILDVRLRRAQQLMRETDLTVTEIGYSCGFGEPSHFSRLFKRRTGLSPRAYIQSVRA